MSKRHDVSRVLGMLAGLGALATIPTSALANGAFPDSFQLLAPADAPELFVMSTNFGVISSPDAGKTWEWACENPMAMNATLYQMGPAPRRRLFAVGLKNIIYTDNLGCDWGASTVAIPGAVPGDVFPDPVDPSRVYGVVTTGFLANAEGILLVSSDAGVSFDKILYRPGKGSVILSVESSRSQPSTIYATLRQGPGQNPKLLRSADAGQTWETIDAAAAVGMNDMRIIAVHPTDPQKVLFRVMSFPSEALAVTEDGGKTLKVPYRLPRRGKLTSFVMRADGSYLLGALEETDGVLLRSTDGGATWTPWTKPPHPRALAERGGTLYVAGSEMTDMFAVASSKNGLAEEGMGLQKFMRFQDISAIRPCAAAKCAAACAFERERKTFPASVCSGTSAQASDAGAGPDAAVPGDGGSGGGGDVAGATADASRAPDAGATADAPTTSMLPDAAAAADTGRDASSTAKLDAAAVVFDAASPGAPTTPEPEKKKSGGCAVAARTTPPGGGAAVLAALGLIALRPRRPRRHRPR